MRLCEVEGVTHTVSPSKYIFAFHRNPAILELSMNFRGKNISDTHFINCFTVQMVVDIIEKNEGIERCLEDVTFVLCSLVKR